MADRTTVTERGQTSIPSRLRHEHRVEAGADLVWEPLGPDEWKVRIERRPEQKPDPVAMLGFARKFRTPRRTNDWMRELRAGER
jgi:bifunctional DNA-binding transcriptional regulator/antitoxin component of YhaV-PrlF toxin-antitoxin module